MNILRILSFLLLFINVSCSYHISKARQEQTVQLFPDSLNFLCRGGFRYVKVCGDDWWISHLMIGDSVMDISRKERIVQQLGNYWRKSCAWLTVERNNDSLTLIADAKKRKDIYKESFQIEIQNRDTTVSLKGSFEGVCSGWGGGDAISPSMRNVMFSCKGGKIHISLKGGQVASVIVDGKKPPVRPMKPGELNNYTCDWLTVHCLPGKSMELQATENLTDEIRTFSVVLSHYDAGALIKGFQQPATDIPSTDTIGFTPNKVLFPLKGGTVEVAAQTDGWILDEKSYGADWVTIKQDSNRLKLTAGPNFDYDYRHFTLRFRKGNYYEYLEGRQTTNPDE